MTEAQRLIEECDKTLSMLRDSWMEAPADKKAKWMDRIHIMLDERNKHMQVRDAGQVKT
jgi:hypothetical protein